MHHSISVIVPSFNQGKYLERTIQSLILQDYPNLEIIIMDGGSSDNSIDIIKKYENKLTSWISAPDNGQSDAINKGFNLGNGEFLTWLNSDDLLLPNTLHKVNKLILRYPQTEWIAGGIACIDKFDRILKIRKGENWSTLLYKLGILNLYGPSTFFRSHLIREHGSLNPDLDFEMDTDLWWRFAHGKIHFKRLNHVCWGFRVHEESKTSGHKFKDSAYSNIFHPSWIKKKKESEYTKDLSRRRFSFVPYFLSLIHKISSFKYIHGLWLDVKYRGININSLKQ